MVGKIPGFDGLSISRELLAMTSSLTKGRLSSVEVVVSMEILWTRLGAETKSRTARYNIRSTE